MTTDDTATTPRRNRRAASPIPSGFPIPHALGDAELYAAVLDVGVSTLHRFRAEGRLPPPIKVGKLSKWLHTTMAETAVTGIPATVAA